MRSLNRTHIWFVAAVTAAVLGAAPAVANADTLGSVTPPAGVQRTTPCVINPTALVAQAVSDPTPFVVPGDGQITQWETNQTGSTAPAGEQLGLVALRNTASGYEVVGTDLETLPTTLPADGIVTFQVANPITVRAGDLLGLWSPASNVPPLCFFESSSFTGDTVDVFGPLSGAPGPGQSLTPLPGNPVQGVVLDLAATFVPSVDDAGVTTAAGPPNAIAGEPALLSSTVTNGNVVDAPITFTDAVPAGLTINSAVAGSGACTVTGQVVTCTISGLTPGQSAPVQIVVTPAAAGIYQNAANISTPANFTDPNLANNAVAAALSVAPAPSATVSSASVAHCVVPALNRIPAPFARRVLGLLDCKVGTVRQVHSKTVAKGQVIRSTPGAGTYAAARRVALQVSSGPTPKKRK